MLVFITDTVEVDPMTSFEHVSAVVLKYLFEVVEARTSQLLIAVDESQAVL